MPPSGPPPPPSSQTARDPTSNPSPVTKPSVFQMPSSTPIPPLHPYNKPPSAAAGASASSAAASLSHPAPNRAPSAGASSTVGGGDLRPSYFSSTLSKEERERALGRPGASRPPELGRPASASSTAHTHTTTAPHHHHHHHHHHTHPPQPSSTATPSAGAAAETKPAGGSGLATSRHDYSPFDTYEKIKAKRDMLDRQDAERRESERKGLSSIQTSPKATASTSIYSRPGMPPSPTDRRSVPTTSSAAPITYASKPSISPQPASATLGGARSIPPISSYSSLSRALPSPFDSNRDRVGAQGAKNESAHLSTLGNSSARPADSSTVSQASPPRSSAQVPSAHRGGFGLPLFPSAQRSPVNRPSTTVPPPDPSRDAARLPSVSASASQPLPKPQTSTYSGFGSAPGFYNSSSYYRNGFGFNDRGERERSERERADKQRYEMERLAEVEREREAKRKAGRTEAQAREEQMRAWDRSERERKEQERERQNAAQGGAFPAIRYDPWTGKEKKPHPTPDGRAYKAEPPAAQYPPETSSAMQQVAPQREPRPYGFKADPQYPYASRDKRSRMDMAVEEQAQRRGAMPKAKKRREDEKPKETAAYTARELAKLVTPNISVPTIVNHLIGRSENVVGREIYEGSTWNLGKTATLRDHLEGLVVIQVSGKFLGPGWVTKLDAGWKESRDEPKDGIVDPQQRLWGTATYTDDSDLIAMLVHDGWVKWADRNTGFWASQDDDVLQVTVLIVPPLIRYYGQKRNGVTSRGWGNGHDGMSITIRDARRQKVTPQLYGGRRDRKMRMAEAAKQRALVLEDSFKTNLEPPVLLQDIGEKELDKKDPMTWGKSGFSYFSETMADIFDVQAARNLHDYDLHLHHGSEVYVLHIASYASPAGTPKLELTQYPAVENHDGDTDMSGGKTSVSGGDVRISVDDLVWADEGLMVLEGGSRKGMLYPADTYSWVKRESRSELREAEDAAELELGQEKIV